MRRNTSGRGAIAALFALALAVTPAFGQQISAEAKEHFASGVTLLKDPDGARYQDAYIQFKLAYEKSGKSWKVLGNLALCSMKLERDGEAIEYYERYLREAGKELDGDEKKQVESDLRVLKSGVAKVTLKADVMTAVQLTDARVRQSGSNLNTYALENGVLVLGVRAGHHTFTAKSGAKDVTWEVDLTPGQAQEHLFPFTEKAPPPVASTPATATTAAPPPPPTSTAPPPPPPSSTMKTIGYVGAGVGGALIVGGVITGLMAKSKFNSVKDSCVTSGSQTLCPQSKQSDVDSAKSLATVTNVLLIGGALVAAGGVTLILVDPGKKEAAANVVAPSLALSPSPLPGGGGFVAHGSFLGVPSMALARSLVLSATFTLAAIIGAGCSIDDGSLTFVPDNQVNQGGGGGSSAAGTGGTSSVGGAAGTSSGGTAGTAGMGGSMPSACGMCANDKCPILADACGKAAKCLECLQNPGMPACATQPEFVAIGACLCKDCQAPCGISPAKCGMGGGAGAGGASGAGGGGKGGTAGVGGSAGSAGTAGIGGSAGQAGAAGKGGGGAGGSSGAGGSGPPTYTTCEPCIAGNCQTELIACNGDTKCAPCINGNVSAECAMNANFKAIQACTCTSDCGQLCKCGEKLCGNGTLDGKEDCDGSNLNGKTCASVIGDPAAFGQLGCSPSCHFDVSTCTSTKAYCGNKKVDQTTEACDTPDLVSATCATVLKNPMATGLLACTYKCGFDTNGCSVPGVCGNGVVEPPDEECDGSKLNNATCATVLGPGATGTLACGPKCKFDASGCMATVSCGNNAIDPGEQCDGPNLNNSDCKKFLNNPLATGNLACNPNCTFNGMACSVPVAKCGNSVKEPGEQCDAADLGGADCKAATGIPNEVGTLGCKPDCSFDVSQCTTGVGTCGDGMRNQSSEQCDGMDFGGANCAIFLGKKNATGALKCNTTCQIDASGCSEVIGLCGNGIKDSPFEECDGADFGGIDCPAWRNNSQAGGTLKCQGCKIIDNCTGGAAPGCGNGVVEGAEDCEPSLPVNAQCAVVTGDPTAGGALSCGADCRWNVSACTTPCGGLCGPFDNVCLGGMQGRCDTSVSPAACKTVPTQIDDLNNCTADFCSSNTGRPRNVPLQNCCPHSMCKFDQTGKTPNKTPISTACDYGSNHSLVAHDCNLDMVTPTDFFCCISGYDQLCFNHTHDPMYTTTQYTCGCQHEFCVKGAALDPHCDPCVEAICQKNPLCCDPVNGSWDASCLDAVTTVCRIPKGSSCF